MEIHDDIKEIININKSQLQIFQWAIASGISSLVYSEYLSRIQQKITPKKLLFIPTIKSVEEFLHPGNQFMEWISTNLIDSIKDRSLFKKYISNSDFKLFDIDILNNILNYYIIPNISKNIPNIIRTKFNLYDENNKVFIENKSIDLFERKDITYRQFDFVVEEILLHLLVLIPTIEKRIIHPEDNNFISLEKSSIEDSILTIGNEKAICDIHFNRNIIENKSIIKLLKFITSITIEESDSQYLITSNSFNNIRIIELK